MKELPRFRDPEAEFKEFERRLKFETRLKYCWFHIKYCNKCFKIEAIAQLNPVFSGFETWLKFVKFGLVCFKINQYDVLTFLWCDTFV